MKPETVVSILVAFVSLAASELWAAGGTSIVARPGQPAHIDKHWPEGVDRIVNDRSRTHGWNDWFSEWPNDVNHYALEVHSNDDLQRLITKLAAVEGRKQVVLCLLPEPRGLGWVTSLDQGNDIPVMFSVGNQERINEWYKRVRKPFGKIEFVGIPIAVPPTLTLFAGHDSIDLDQLVIPEGIEVRSGYVPRLFHKTNFKRDRKAEQKPEARIRFQSPQLPPDQQRISEEIEAWLKKREASVREDSKEGSGRQGDGEQRG